MIPFLVALLVALVAGGLLVVLWRENRRALAITAGGMLAAVLLVLGYVLLDGAGRVLPPDEGPLLTGLVLEPVAGSYRLSGTLQNRSPTHALSALPLTLVLEDCEAQGTCSRPRQATVELLLSVPPGATREFRQVFHLDPAPPGSELRWRVETGAPRVQPAAG